MTDERKQRPIGYMHQGLGRFLILGRCHRTDAVSDNIEAEDWATEADLVAALLAMTPERRAGILEHFWSPAEILENSKRATELWQALGQQELEKRAASAEATLEKARNWLAHRTLGHESSTLEVLTRLLHDTAPAQQEESADERLEAIDELMKDVTTESINALRVTLESKAGAIEPTAGEAPRTDGIFSEHVVAGAWMSKSIGDHVRACETFIVEEQERANPDTALIGLLCDSVRMAREYCRDREVKMPAPPTGNSGGGGVERVTKAEATNALMQLVDVDKVEHVSTLQRYLMQTERQHANHSGAGGGDEDGYDMATEAGGTHRDVRNYLSRLNPEHLGSTVTETLLRYVDRQEQSEREATELREQLDDVCAVLYNTGATRGDALTRAKRALESYNQHIDEQVALEEERDSLRAELQAKGESLAELTRIAHEWNETGNHHQAYRRVMQLLGAKMPLLEPPQPTSASQAKLGGPVDAFREELVKALRQSSEQPLTFGALFRDLADRLENGAGR